MLGRSFRVPFLTLAPIDQGDKELCVAASFAQAIYGTAFSHEPLVRASVLRMPCCWIMYYRGCYNECSLSGRCRCAQQCAGICDPECGTTILSLIDLIPSREWISADMQCKYTVSRVESIRSDDHASLARALNQAYPVVVNLFLYANQVNFFESHHLLVSGAGYRESINRSKVDDDNSDIALMTKRPPKLYLHDSFTNYLRVPTDGIRSPIVLLPFRYGAKQSRGHCVTAVGMFEHNGQQYVRLRNSFGARWGIHGDFSMRLEDFVPEQVHMMCFVPHDAIRVSFVRHE